MLLWTTVEGEECFNELMWGVQSSITQHPECPFYEDSHFHLHTCRRHLNCPTLCATQEPRENLSCCNLGVSPRTWLFNFWDASGVPIQMKALCYRQSFGITHAQCVSVVQCTTRSISHSRRPYLLILEHELLKCGICLISHDGD